MPVTDFPEIQNLLSWLGNPPRHPDQTHKENQSDCEIIKLQPDRYLAATTDSLSEEIAYGLYRDPYTMGWVCATASLSDLAAVGASPLGLLFSAQWAPEFTLEQKKECARGFNDALRESQTFLLGGDTGTAVSTLLTSTGLGICDSPPVGRVGAKPGDLVCILGKMGVGPALGFQHLLQVSESAVTEKDFRPKARISAGVMLRQVATSAVDTSDGLAVGLHTLQKLNGVGMDLLWNSNLLDERAVRFCHQADLPLTSLYFGEHGDFQILFTFDRTDFLKIRQKIKELHVLGEIRPPPLGVSMKTDGGERVPIDLGFAQSLPKDSLKDLHKSFETTLEYLDELNVP